MPCPGALGRHPSTTPPTTPLTVPFTGTLGPGTWSGDLVQDPGPAPRFRRFVRGSVRPAPAQEEPMAKETTETTRWTREILTRPRRTWSSTPTRTP